MSRRPLGQVPRKPGAAMRLTKVQRDACDALAICASERTHNHLVYIYTSDITMDTEINEISDAAFEEAGRLLPLPAPMEEVYALAECLIRTGEVG